VEKRKQKMKNSKSKSKDVTAAAEPMVANIATLPFFSSASRRLRKVSTSPSLDKPRGSKYPKGAWQGIAWVGTCGTHWNPKSFWGDIAMYSCHVDHKELFKV